VARGVVAKRPTAMRQDSKGVQTDQVDPIVRKLYSRMYAYQPASSTRPIFFPFRRVSFADTRRNGISMHSRRNYCG
jgi:hypothetical protein